MRHSNSSLSPPILIPNETEFAALINRNLCVPRGRAAFTPASLRALVLKSPSNLHGICRRVGVPVVAITLGDKGCFISQPSGYARVPAIKCIDVVDTTGAGDAFVGGFAAGLLETPGDILAAALYGTATAALSVGRPGTAPSMPTRREILSLLKKSRGIAK